MSETAVQETQETPNSVPTPSETQPTPPKRKRRWLRGLLLTLVVLVCALAGVIAWLVGTESGLRFGLYKIPSWFGVKIASETLEGTLVKGFHGDKWMIETDGADVKISAFRFDWKPSELFQRSLHITEIVAGDIAVVPKQTPPKEKKPSKGLPESIDLPVLVFVDRLETGRLSVGKNFDKQTVYLDHLNAAYHYDQKEHRLDLKALDTPWSNSTGSAVVGLEKPFALNTTIQTKGELEGETIEGKARLWGSLQDVQTEILLDGDNVHLSAKSTVHPFAASLDKMIGEVLIKGFNINPTAFLPSLPKANLTFDATVVPSFTHGIALDGSLDLENKAAGFADDKAIPVRNILADFTINDNGVVTVQESEIGLLEEGSFNVAGTVDTVKNALALKINVNNLVSDDLVRTNVAGQWNGFIGVKGETASPAIDWNLESGSAQLSGLLSFVTDRQHGQRTLKLDRVRVAPQNGGELTAQGSLELFKDRLLKLDVSSKAFNPSRLDSKLPAGSVNGTINLSGELAKEKFAGKMQFAPSTLNNVPLSGKADVVYESGHLPRALTDLRLGNNIVKTNGSFGKKGDRLNIDITAPDLSRFGFGLGGLLNMRGYISGDLKGGLKTYEADLSGEARALRVGDAVNIRMLDFKLKGTPDINRPLAADIKGSHIALSGGSTVIDAVNLSLNGTGAQHRIYGSSSMALDGKPYKLEVNAAGGLNKDFNQWKGSVDTLDIGGAFNLKLQNRMNLEAGAERVSMSAARWSAMGGSLNLQNFVWDKKAGITSKGSAQSLHITELQNFVKIPVEHNLVLGGDWDLAYSQNARGYLNINRQSGDIILPNKDPKKQMPLGLSALSLRTRFQNGRIDSTLDGSTRFGSVNADLGISQQFGNKIANAPISGKINLNVPDLGAIKTFLPATAQGITGRLNAAATIGGRVGSPTIAATLNGTSNYGTAEGTVNIGQGASMDTAPLSGKLNLNVADLEVFRNFLPVGQTVKGRLNAAVSLGGRVSDPQLSGTLNGENLYYRNQTQGLILDNGVLRSHLQGQRWIIDSLKFHKGGTLELKGSVNLANADPDVDVDVVFDKYDTLSRPNRRLRLSGSAKVQYNQARGFILNGTLGSDYGMFGSQKSSMPSLDDDVVVLGEEKKQTAAVTPINLNLTLNLNDNIRFVGYGADITIGGKLTITSRPGEAIQGVGTVKVVKGRYKAYGQDLDITKGTVSFVGPLNNPNLNIRAERRLSPVGAGVEVLGSLNNPRVTLVAKEAMSEKDKLSWLILNRASSGSDGDNAALSAAAGALLAGQVNDRLGLVDDLGITSQRSRNAQTGELNPAEQVLTVGKQFTNNLYAGYEYGLSSAEQSVKLVYQLTRAIQAVARVGSRSYGGELKYTIRFDRLFRSDYENDRKIEEAEKQKAEQTQ